MTRKIMIATLISYLCLPFVSPDDDGAAALAGIFFDACATTISLLQFAHNPPAPTLVAILQNL